MESCKICAIGRYPHFDLLARSEMCPACQKFMEFLDRMWKVASRLQMTPELLTTRLQSLILSWHYEQTGGKFPLPDYH